MLRHAVGPRCWLAGLLRQVVLQPVLLVETAGIADISSLLHVTPLRRTMLHVTSQEALMGTTNVNSRVQKHRDAMRMAGLRPVQIWVPDTRRPDFAEECRRQCLLVAQADSADTALHTLMDDALADVDGWTE